MKTSIRLFLLGIGLCTLVVISCSKESKMVPVQFMLTDNPTDYDEVNVHLKGIQVNIAKDSTSWISLDAKDTMINLLDLQGGITTLIATGTVPEGVLKEVRFVLGDGNNIVVNGTEYPMDTPSGETSGLKIKIGKQLNESLNTFVMDFDAALSIKEENGAYKLSPVIKLK
jgi:hypothetical protein